MCDDAVHKDAWLLEFVLDHFKAQKMCERAVKEDRDSLIQMWYIDYSHVTAPEPRGYDDRAIKWYQGYKKRKAQKANIKDELMSISWHPSRS